MPMNNDMKPIPNEKSIGTLRSDPGIHDSSMCFSNAKLLCISWGYLIDYSKLEIKDIASGNR